MLQSTATADILMLILDWAVGISPRALRDAEKAYRPQLQRVTEVAAVAPLGGDPIAVIEAASDGSQDEQARSASDK